MKITSKNDEICSKCVYLMKITSKNVEMCSKCVDFMKMTSENVEFALAPARRNARSDCIIANHISILRVINNHKKQNVITPSCTLPSSLSAPARPGRWLQQALGPESQGGLQTTTPLA